LTSNEQPMRAVLNNTQLRMLFQELPVNWLYTIGGLDYWTGLLDWTTGLLDSPKIP